MKYRLIEAVFLLSIYNKKSLETTHYSGFETFMILTNDHNFNKRFIGRIFAHPFIIKSKLLVKFIIAHLN